MAPRIVLFIVVKVTWFVICFVLLCPPRVIQSCPPTNPFYDVTQCPYRPSLRWPVSPTCKTRNLLTTTIFILRQVTTTAATFVLALKRVNRVAVPKILVSHVGKTGRRTVGLVMHASRAYSSPLMFHVPPAVMQWVCSAQRGSWGLCPAAWAILEESFCVNCGELL